MTDPTSTPSKPAGKKTGARESLGHSLRGTQLSRTPDYLVIGHITADLQADGSVVLGGTALYSALTAARLGAKVGILTRGAFGIEVAGMKIPPLEPFADQVSIIVQDADVPTTFINEYRADLRVQTVPHWAGEIDLRGLPPHWRNAPIVHLGPVLQEINPNHAVGMTTEFIGITPQGWMRDWPRATGGKVRHIPLRLPGSLLGRTDCAIVSTEEIHQAREVVERVGEQRLAVVTRGKDGARVIARGQTIDLPGFKVKTKDLTGAGDVFAAAFFLKAADKTIAAATAGRFANAVAALSLREIGVEAVPTMEQVDALLANSM
ncbi:MAG: PfkB family carbohydrate kinase [Thermomicrobiales bacterium]